VGLGMIVIEDYPQPDVKLDYFGGTSGSYAGFDRFDRIVQQLWRDYGASQDREKYTYGYDRAGNRLYRENVGASGKDEFYTYLCPCQLAGAGFLGPVGRRLSRETGRCSLSHNSIAA
jgi:hypothetical protein